MYHFEKNMRKHNLRRSRGSWDPGEAAKNIFKANLVFDKIKIICVN